MMLNIPKTWLVVLGLACVVTGMHGSSMPPVRDVPVSDGSRAGKSRVGGTVAAQLFALKFCRLEPRAPGPSSRREPTWKRSPEIEGYGCPID